MARVTRLENFYRCRLLRVTGQLRVDCTGKPATGYSGVGYRHPGRFRARPRGQREPLVKGVNGKPVIMPGIRGAGRIIADRAFAVVGPARPRRKLAGWNIGRLRADRKRTRLNSSHIPLSLMPSSAC